MKKGQLGDITIPGCISDRQDIMPAAQKLYAVIYKLIDWANFKYGRVYCYPSNYWLCDKFAKRSEGKSPEALPVRTLSSWLKLLETKGYIRREIAVYKGKSQRRIYLSDEYIKMLPPQIEDDEGFDAELDIAEEDLTERDYPKNESENEPENLWHKTATPSERNIFLGEDRQKTAEGSAENCHHNNIKQTRIVEENYSNLDTNPPYPPRCDKVGFESNRSIPPPNNLPAPEEIFISKKEESRHPREKLKTPEELSAEGRIPIGKFKNIWLTPSELEQLKTEFSKYNSEYGADLVADMIEQLSAYVTHRPRYCQNVYYATVRDWCLRRRERLLKLRKNAPDGFSKIDDLK